MKSPDRENPEPDGLLPTVRPEIAGKLMGDLAENPRFVIDALERIDSENPELAALVRVAAGSAPTQEDRLNMVRLAALMYESLRSQAEADRMNGSLS